MGNECSADMGECCRGVISAGESTNKKNVMQTSRVRENSERFCQLMAEAGKSDSLQVLLKNWREFDVSAADERGNTALHLAAQHGHLICCRLLVQHGAKANAVNNEGFTAERVAIRHHQNHVAEYLKAVAAASVMASPKGKHRPIGQATHPAQPEEGTPRSHISASEEEWRVKDPPLSPNSRVSAQMYQNPGQPIVDLV